MNASHETSFDSILSSSDYEEFGSYKDIQNAVLPLFIEKGARYEGIGTSFAIRDDGLLVSARHVVKDYLGPLADGELTDVRAYVETNHAVDADGRTLHYAAVLRLEHATLLDSSDLILIKVTRSA